MAWKKRFNSLHISPPFISSSRSLVWVVVFLCNAFVTQSQDSLWTKSEWEQDKKGYVYIDPNEKPEQTEDLVDTDIIDEPDWNLNLSDTARMAILVSFVIVLAGLLIYFFWGSGDKNARVNELDLNMQELELNLDKIDPDQFINKVLESSDYKTAVRLLFLSTIRQLHLIKWINWKKDKTNYDFLREMRTRDQYKAFRDLTLAFEVVWYGDTNITAEQYQRIKEKFDSLIQTLPNEK